MTQKKRIQSLFNQLCLEMGLNNFNENPDYNKKSLYMDFNSIYGGYRIDTIKGDGSTGQGDLVYSSRFSNKEMASFIQGILFGLTHKI